MKILKFECHVYNSLGNIVIILKEEPKSLFFPLLLSIKETKIIFCSLETYTKF
jgi:hypothetical protein